MLRPVQPTQEARINPSGISGDRPIPQLHCDSRPHRKTGCETPKPSPHPMMPVNGRGCGLRKKCCDWVFGSGVRLRFSHIWREKIVSYLLGIFFFRAILADSRVYSFSRSSFAMASNIYWPKHPQFFPVLSRYTDVPGTFLLAIAIPEGVLLLVYRQFFPKRMQPIDGYFHFDSVDK